MCLLVPLSSKFYLMHSLTCFQLNFVAKRRSTSSNNTLTLVLSVAMAVHAFSRTAILQVVIQFFFSTVFITTPTSTAAESLSAAIPKPHTSLHTAVFLTPSIVIFDLPSASRFCKVISLLTVLSDDGSHVIPDLSHRVRDACLPPRLQGFLDSANFVTVLRSH